MTLGFEPDFDRIEEDTTLPEPKGSTTVESRPEVKSSTTSKPKLTLPVKIAIGAGVGVGAIALLTLVR